MSSMGRLCKSLMRAGDDPHIPSGAAVVATAEKWQEWRQPHFTSSCLLCIGGCAETAGITGSPMLARDRAAGVVWNALGAEKKST